MWYVGGKILNILPDLGEAGLLRNDWRPGVAASGRFRHLLFRDVLHGRA